MNIDLQLYKDKFNSDVMELVKYIDEFMDDDKALLGIIQDLSSSKKYDERGIKYLVALYVVARISIFDEKKVDTYYDVFAEMTNIEKRIKEYCKLYEEDNIEIGTLN